MMPMANIRAYPHPCGIVTDPVSYVGAGAIAYGSTSVSPAYPAGIQADDLVLMVIGIKPNTISATVPTGWATVTSIQGGGGTTGLDTGPTNLMILRDSVVTGSETGTVGVTVTSGNSVWAQIIVFRKATGYSWNIAAATGTDSTTGTTWSVACSSAPGFTIKDMFLTAGVIPTDVGAGATFSSHGVTASGATLGSITEIVEANSATGNDIGGYTAYGFVTAGTSTSNPTITATAGGTTTNVRGPGAIVRIRATYPAAPTDFNPANRAIVGWWKAASANVTLSGADVTNWNDLTANNNDGVTPGFGANPSFNSTDSEIANHASITFDNTNGDGEGLDADGMGALITGPFTVSVTAKISVSTNFGALWGISNGGIQPYIYNGTENPSLCHVTSEDTGGANFASGSVTHDSSWHVYTTVVTAVKVGGTAGSFKFYIDGVEKSMTDPTIQGLLPFNNFKIGMFQGNALGGKIAEVAVYNEAFDATTVRQDALWMAADKGMTIP